jgi:hypothetical protein
MYKANQAEFHGDADAQAYRDSADAAMTEAVAFLPQRDWHPDLVMAVDPGSAYSMGQTAGALVGGGASIVRQLAVPNPYGRRGGPEHEAARAEAMDAAKSYYDNQGVEVYIHTEYGYATPGGQKATRYADFAVLTVDAKELLELHQVGQVTQGGVPVSRERAAISDLVNFGGFAGPIRYHPYWKTR